MLRSAFICWRPYQLMNAINFVENNINVSKKNSDLFIIDLNSMSTYVDSLKAHQIFNNIIVVNPVCYKRNMWGKINRLYYFMNPTKNISRQIKDYAPNYFSSYHYVYASGLDPFFINFAIINKEASICLLEDGLGSYLDDPRTLELSAGYKLLNKLFHKGAYRLKFDVQYLNCISVSINDANYRFANLPPIDKDIIELLKTIFHYKREDIYKKRRFIFLGTDMSNINLDVNSVLLDYSDMVIYRKHPMQTLGKDEVNNLHVDNGENLWELICTEYMDETKILIGDFSAAQFTPYLLYKKKPILIFLYKITHTNRDSMYDLIMCFINKYQETTKQQIYMPNTIEEFKEILKKLA